MESEVMEKPVLPSFTKTAHSEPYPYISPTRPELSAAGKNVVITGGGTGLGKAIALAFAQAGAKSVSIIGRRLNVLQSTAAEISKAGPDTQVLYESGDVMAKEKIEAALKAITDKVGKIDVLVAGAGAMTAFGSMLDYEGKELMRAFEINVIGVLYTIQAFHALASPGAVLINIPSNLAHVRPWPGTFGYSVSKAANTKVVDYFASENPEFHVVNMHPGLVQTDLNRDFGVPEVDSPHLAGHFSVWLASPEARFLKSKFVWAHWDAQEMMERADEIKNSMLLTVHLDGLPL